MEKSFYVYVMASGFNGALYTGVTSDLPGRVHEHKEGTFEGFTKKYKVNRLVWYEAHDTAEAAIVREKQVKEWKRDWKKNLIERENPHWEDLYESICR
jgi:putative endonuclease